MRQIPHSASTVAGLPMSVSRERSTRMVRPCTVQILWHGLLEGLSSGGRYNLHPETNWISQSWSDHPLSEQLFPSSPEWQRTAFGIQKLSTWNVLTNFKTVVKMPVKDMISCKLAHVCATPHCNSNTHNSLTDLTSPISTMLLQQFDSTSCAICLRSVQVWMVQDEVATLKAALYKLFICQNYHWQQKQAQFQHVRPLTCDPALNVLPLQQFCFDFPSLLR